MQGIALTNKFDSNFLLWSLWYQTTLYLQFSFRNVDVLEQIGMKSLNYNLKADVRYNFISNIYFEDTTDPDNKNPYGAF